MIIDASNAVAGRLAAYAAKRLLEGEQVVIVNAEKAVISGDEEEITLVYRKRRGMTQKANPEHAMKWPRRPDFLLKRIIKGMLPKRSNRKTTALKALRVYVGKPASVTGTPVTPIKTSDKLARGFVSIEKICANLGWKAAV